MYDITAFALDFPWQTEAWTSEIGNSVMTVNHAGAGGKDLSRLTTQYLIWGLNHLMLSMYLSRRYCRTIATLKWEGIVVGSVQIAPSESRTTNATIKPQIMVPGEDIEVVISYRARSPPIPRELIYLTAIKATGEAAEAGLDNPIQEIVTQSIQRTWWKLSGGHHSLTGVLRPRHSRYTILQTLETMVQDRKFQALFVGVTVNGENVAVGGFGQGDAMAVSRLPTF
ncbi:MAG: hypothetical protein L6R41_002130 [Letrouitia leprolyta]|nr:MAG: hypothetical protein L6R41_002130 [Letrouitia leprolyta]